MLVYMHSQAWVSCFSCVKVMLIGPFMNLHLPLVPLAENVVLIGLQDVITTSLIVADEENQQFLRFCFVEVLIICLTISWIWNKIMFSDTFFDTQLDTITETVEKHIRNELQVTMSL